jgi:hypothetical protein
MPGVMPFLSGGNYLPALASIRVAGKRVGVTLMNKTVRRVWLASSLILLCAAGSSYVGEWNYHAEDEQLIRWWAARGFQISHAYPDPNIWQIVGGILFLAGVTIALAALILWQNHRA